MITAPKNFKTFEGVTPDIVERKYLFECIEIGNTRFYVSKKIYKFKNSDFPFSYRYVIEFYKSLEDGKYIVALDVVPLPSKAPADIEDDIKKYFEDFTKDDENYMNYYYLQQCWEGIANMGTMSGINENEIPKSLALIESCLPIIDDWYGKVLDNRG